MGDLNAKVGEGRFIGRYGLGNRNEKGTRWIKCSTENGQTIKNT